MSFVFPIFVYLNIRPRCDSVSGPQEGKPLTGPVSAPSPASSLSHSRTAMEPGGGSRLRSDQPRRTRQGQRRRTFSCSPQRWASQTERTRADSGTSEFGLESDSSESQFQHSLLTCSSETFKNEKKNLIIKINARVCCII